MISRGAKPSSAVDYQRDRDILQGKHIHHKGGFGEQVMIKSSKDQSGSVRTAREKKMLACCQPTREMLGCREGFG